MYGLLRRLAGVSIGSSSKGYASFTLRDVVRETSDEAGTLLARFAKHIAVERYKDENHVLSPTTIRYADYFPITDDRYFQRSVEKTAASQLPALIIHASSYRANAATPKYAMALNALDAQCVSQLDKMDTTTVLETLYAFLFLIPNWLKRTDFYYKAVNRLAREFHHDDSKERFVQVCFYLGLQKKTQNTSELRSLLESHLEKHLPNLSEMDLAVICNAAYKTSTLVTGELREAFESALIRGILSIQLGNGQDALLVSYVKSLRLQRAGTEEVCRHLANICMNPAEISQLEPRGLTHILAFFAEQLWDQSDCLKVLVDRLSPLNMRAKDFATFLWASAQLNIQFSASRLKQLELVALRKLENREYDYFPDNLVDTCLSLSCFGHYSKQLIDAAEDLKASQRRQRAQPKVDSRLTTLRSAIAIEQPSWSELQSQEIFKEFARTPSYLLKDRSDLTTYARDLTSDAEIEGVDLVCPISGINLPSLRVQTVSNPSKIYFVELLTPQQTLRFSQQPTSLMRLKRRLLESLGQKVVVLHSDKMASNAKELQELLEASSETKKDESDVALGLSI
ncbi:uncharacterized protein Dwil_GK15578 [Drosophila willistoni]|uniref:RAP domain-containing protein n=1 Tax=Drosophila willistoni TaxID=7260 RepID=B4MX29_DROWI|nr:uncharacterized protein LOC6642608 [Drosophila willistoni]EDW76668.1 uncharacterized protein Dwil_GK15578 [Drosophila willistoni]